MARRFSSLAGLKLLLKNELAASASAREKALKTLQDLTDVYHERPDSLVEQVILPESLAYLSHWHMANFDSNRQSTIT